jgi:hypothetical protein
MAATYPRASATNARRRTIFLPLERRDQQAHRLEVKLSQRLARA